MCACVEGGVLDDFGYVKEDFLIVDSVHLTYKCFKSIGMEVPTFDELREKQRWVGHAQNWGGAAPGATVNSVSGCAQMAMSNRAAWKQS